MHRIVFFSIFLVISNCNSINREISDSKSSVFPINSEQKVVCDYSDILTEIQERELTQKLIIYEAKTTNEIAVLTMDSITPYTDIQKYASDLANYWGVGQKDKDNGLMIVLSKPMRQVGIATGLGTEKILTDSICKQVIETTMIPNFKEDRYYEGISAGLDSLIYKWGN